MTPQDAVVSLQNAFWLRAEHLLLHHTNPWELDEALTGWGYGMGPCEAQDLIGLEPVLARVPQRPVPILPRMVVEGRMGKIGGVGYYRYPGGGGAVIDPLIEDLIREEAWFAKVERMEMADADLVEQMNDALHEEGRQLLLQGVSQAELDGLLTQAVHLPRSKGAAGLQLT